MTVTCRFVSNANDLTIKKKIWFIKQVDLFSQLTTIQYPLRGLLSTHKMFVSAILYLWILGRHDNHIIVQCCYVQYDLYIGVGPYVDNHR